jgi:hypothetical protein
MVSFQEIHIYSLENNSVLVEVCAFTMLENKENGFVIVVLKFSESSAKIYRYSCQYRSSPSLSTVWQNF